MQTILVEQLKSDLTFTGDLLLDSSFILLPHTAPVTNEMIKALKVWGFENILCDGGVSLGGDIGVTKNHSDFEDQSSSTTTISESVKKAIESTKNAAIGDSDKSRMEMVQAVYDEYMNYIESVFTHYATHKKINQEELSETVQELCIFIKDHRRYILRINPTSETCKKNFLVIHSMRTTVLAIAIALQLHLPLSKMIELGVSTILHEIGMLRVPPQLYMSSKKLTPGERAQISKHTLFGYSIIKELDFPLVVQLGVLEHHEKENGTGYPRRLMGDKISSNAKIISVACSYEAISSVREYKEERSTFDALLEMIQNKKRQYDDAVIKALLFTVSLYPIGTYVYLSNRKVAIVVDTNPDNPKTPIVQLLTEKDKDGAPKVVQTGNDISILRILSRQERDDILRLLEGKYRNIENAQKEAEEIEANKQIEDIEEIEEAEEVFDISAEPIPDAPEVIVEPPVTPEPAAVEIQEPKTEPKPAPAQEQPQVQKNSASPAANSNSPEGTEDVDLSFFGMS